jgi:hypothetical protein
VPVNPIVCGLFAALLEIIKVPAREPAAVGVNVTLTEQVDPAPREVPHVFA